jgi:predicted Zn-dependent protease
MERGQSNWFDDILSTHPNTGERIQRIQAEMASMRLSANLSEDSIGFHAMKLALKLLPTPVKPHR